MKLYQGFYNINNIELIYIRNFPVSQELTFLSTDKQSLTEVIYEAISRERFYVFKIGNNYYSAESLEHSNTVTTELIMINVPTLYIVNEQLKNVVGVNNITKFEISTVSTAPKISNAAIFVNEDYQYRTDFNVMNVCSFSQFEKVIEKYDMCILNHEVSFIGLNDNFKIYGHHDITYEYLQRLFIYLKTMCVLTRFYSIENVIVMNCDDTKLEPFSAGGVYFKNINGLKLENLLTIFELIKTQSLRLD